MKISWSKQAWEDYVYWQQNDKKRLKRINKLVKEAILDPFQGIGSPEPLRHELQGFWSRRIDKAHRLVYAFEDDELLIVACRHHY